MTDTAAPGGASTPSPPVLAATLADITTRLRQNKFSNEQQVSQGIVLRILEKLGWNIWDASVVWPEFQTGEGRADFALCHPPSKPAVVVEVKQVGKSEDAVRQALGYAFHCGAPFVVLTDGRIWNFYLPAEQGDYEDRRVCRIDLYERSTSEAAEDFQRYLSRANVESGKSLEAAKTEFHNRKRRLQARGAIPEAWRELVKRRDGGLIEILLRAVESEVGFRPEADDISDFLGNLHASTLPDQRSDSPSLAPRPGPAPDSSRRRRGTGRRALAPRPSPAPDPPLPALPGANRANRLLLLGKEYSCSSAKETMVIVLRELANSNPSFLERCARHPEAQGRTTRYIARTPEELYPYNEERRSYCEKLPGGWLVATNLNNAGKRGIINMAAEVARLKFGKDIVIEF